MGPKLITYRYRPIGVPNTTELPSAHAYQSAGRNGVALALIFRSYVRVGPIVVSTVVVDGKGPTCQIHGPEIQKLRKAHQRFLLYPLPAHSPPSTLSQPPGSGTALPLPLASASAEPPGNLSCFLSCDS
jgi:hypothetical protein